MTATPNDTGMGPEAPATTTRSTRRTRRLAIVGALALVLVAGAVLVGVKTTGARSGSLTSGMTSTSINMKCVTPFGSNGVYPITITFSSDSTSHQISYHTSADGGGDFVVAKTASGSYSSTNNGFDAISLRYTVTWGSSDNLHDTKYDSAACTRS